MDTTVNQLSEWCGQMCSVMTPPAVGTAQPRETPTDPFSGSRYAALDRLSEGTAGALYVIEHRELGKRFVAKLLHTDQRHDATLVDRLRLEAQSLGRLRHPNIVAITGFEHTADGRPFIVMELLRGRTLAEDVRERHHLPPDEALRWATRLASALQAAHAIGIIHRDLCPDNVFLHQTATGAIVPKLLDFGSAFVQRGQTDRTPSPLAVPTTAGTILVAPEFCAPEMAQGRPADARTDVYQLGLLLYLMLTGRSAFEGVNDDPRWGAPGAKSLPDPPSRHAAGLAPELDRVVLRALTYSPEDRYQTISEFHQQLTELATTALHAPRAPRTRATLGVLLFLSLAAFAAILVLGVAYLLGYWQ